jgi:hypothetical protein
MELLSGIISWCQGGVGVEVLAFDGCCEILPLMKAKHFTLMKAKIFSFHESKTYREYFIFGALCPSKSGLMNKHIVKHIVNIS